VLTAQRGNTEKEADSTKNTEKEADSQEKRKDATQRTQRPEHREHGEEQEELRANPSTTLPSRLRVNRASGRCKWAEKPGWRRESRTPRAKKKPRQRRGAPFYKKEPTRW
jgi:hypothetical protein